jgi:hypothetical protein
MSIGQENTQPVYLGLNNKGLLLTTPDEKQKEDASWGLVLLKLLEKSPKVSDLYGNKEFKQSRFMISIKEGLNLAKGSPDPDAASRRIQRSG